jgi:hypothetical protein
MSKLLKNTDWPRPVKPVAALGWSRWARTISSRHQRIGSRHRFAVMRLLHRANPIFQSSHRWELRALSLFPRINLAIRPILHQSSLKGSPVDRPFLLSRTREIREPRTLRHGDLQTAVDRFLKTQRRPGESSEVRTNADPTQTASVMRSIAMSGELTGDRNFVPDHSNLAGQRPLSRVFRRLARPEAETQGRTRLTKQMLETTRRVTEERRRIERYTFTTAAVRQEQVSRKILNQTMETQRKLEDQILSLSKGRGLSDNAQGSWPISASDDLSIQQLSEQVMRRIDDKIVAHKERMGTLF